MKIQHVNIGNKIATDLEIQCNFMTSDKEFHPVYMLYAKNGQMVAQGRVHINEQEMSNWGYNISYLENLVLMKLDLVRLIEN